MSGVRVPDEPPYHHIVELANTQPFQGWDSGFDPRYGDHRANAHKIPVARELSDSGRLNDKSGLDYSYNR